MPVGIPSLPRRGRWKPRSRAMLGTVGGYQGEKRTLPCIKGTKTLLGFSPVFWGLKHSKFWAYSLHALHMYVLVHLRYVKYYLTKSRKTVTNIVATVKIPSKL
jgi:hypothetical protein